MSAAAKAEARRKAILARGGDRLAKLTSSARGEDASAYMHDDPPLAALPSRPTIETFVGEQTEMPTPQTSTLRSARSSRMASGSQPADEAQEQIAEQMRQLQQLLAAGAGDAPQGPGLPPPPGGDADPLAALMSSMAQAGNMPQMSTEKAAMAKPKTLLHKVLPLIHLLGAWVLLAYFVIWKEPQLYESKTHGLNSESIWRRWSELGWKSADEGWGVQSVPFFWAFTTLALLLHSWRVFSKLDTPRPPMLLSLALPYLPPPIPSVVTNGLAYLQLGGIFLDDIAGVIFCIGLLIWLAGWSAN
ncbi:hypothetical protein WOLCODRAFT_134951 [Wolfiporia cocos MD-104 SS10]|uniref:Uncharacterized protein n=1 Tax=Wolfiporia cocos (strain MD-104) TaxID=742152 RepID=A0A2H3J346_WOLCO|nr:hypothetical protein WOLCODRAFT_134951 [Wolfiporia cocos MD-104 SS10]